MQNAGNFGEVKRVTSPDITCIPYTFQNHCLPSPIGHNNFSCVQNVNSIGEVPQGFYEYVVGDNGEVKILCKICHYISNKKSNFKRHFVNMHFIHHHDDKPLECCGIRFNTKGDKVQHTKSVHKFGYKCVICMKVFDRPALLQRHLAKHTGKKPYKCSLCTYQTPNKANAKRHIEKKHSDSDIQEGAILFVTDDGEQIQMESMPRSSRTEMGASSSVVKSSADSSTSFCFPGEAEDLSMFKSPRFPPSSTVTSSSYSSPENDALDNSTSSFYGAAASDSRRHIGHSVEKIIGVNQTAAAAESSFIDSLLNIGTMHRGINVSSNNPGNGCISNSHFSKSHLDTNQQRSEWYYPPNWSHSSSLLPPINNNSDYAAASAKAAAAVAAATLQASYPQQSFMPPPPPPPATAPLSNQGSSSSPPFVFHQCVHGCWHWVVNNQVASNFSSYDAYQGAYFLPRSPSSHCSMLPSPDLRFPSSLSQQTENSSVISSKSEDEDEIDIVGEDDDELDYTKLRLLSSICDGLGNCSTSGDMESQRNNDNDSNNNEDDEDMNEKDRTQGQSEKKPLSESEGSPPVESIPSPRSSTSSSINTSREENDAVDGDENHERNVDEYIPKKLRMSRSRTLCN